LSSLDDPALWYIARTPRNGFGRLAGSRSVTARSLNAKAKIITRAGQQRYASAIRNSGADEVIIPEYENACYPTFARRPRSHYYFQFEISNPAEQGIRLH